MFVRFTANNHRIITREDYYLAQRNRPLSEIVGEGLSLDEHGKPYYWVKQDIWDSRRPIGYRFIPNIEEISEGILSGPLPEHIVYKALWTIHPNSRFSTYDEETGEPFPFHRVNWDDWNGWRDARPKPTFSEMFEVMRKDKIKVCFFNMSRDIINKVSMFLEEPIDFHNHQILVDEHIINMLKDINSENQSRPGHSFPILKLPTTNGEEIVINSLEDSEYLLDKYYNKLQTVFNAKTSTQAQFHKEAKIINNQSVPDHIRFNHLETIGFHTQHYFEGFLSVASPTPETVEEATQFALSKIEEASSRKLHEIRGAYNTHAHRLPNSDLDISKAEAQLETAHKEGINSIIIRQMRVRDTADVYTVLGTVLSEIASIKVNGAPVVWSEPRYVMNVNVSEGPPPRNNILTITCNDKNNEPLTDVNYRFYKSTFPKVGINDFILDHSTGMMTYNGKDPEGDNRERIHIPVGEYTLYVEACNSKGHTRTTVSVNII